MLGGSLLSCPAPGFPIMVPGQVITAETIQFMRKLDVKDGWAVGYAVSGVLLTGYFATVLSW